MTFQEKAKLVLRKYPEAKFKRGLFAWYCGVEFYEFNDIINAATKDNFAALFNDWESLSRALRDVLKLEEFKLPPENESRLQELNSGFKKDYATKKTN